MEIQNKASTEIAELIKIVALLRDPQKGCAWDLQQTHSSLIPYLLEEAYEAVHAIRTLDYINLCEELGDLFLQILLHAQIANENEQFSLERVAKVLKAKLIRRHPHVFGKSKEKDIDKIKTQWEEIKKSEKGYSSSENSISQNLTNKVNSQSAIAGAMHISKKTAEAGFEWKSIDIIWSKVYEELEELKEALKNKNNFSAEEELGDVLFSIINIARISGLNPEEGLTSSNHKFLKRFSYIESQINGQFSKTPTSQLERLWKIAKQEISQQ